MMPRGLLVLVLAAAGCSSRANGAPAPWRRAVLVELFTSQGCSSCPPADAFVRELPSLGLGRDKVVPLTFHVDYWDRLGWKDPFASRAFTGRQQWYAASGKLRSPDGTSGLDGLYTPQMIVDGTVHFSGQRRQVAVREIERAATRPAQLELAIQAKVLGDEVDVTARIAGAGGPRDVHDWRVLVALAARRARTAVGGGENAGDTLDQVAVVRALSQRSAISVAGAAVVLRVSKPMELSWREVDVVAFVQSEASREIGAVRVLDASQLLAN